MNPKRRHSTRHFAGDLAVLIYLVVIASLILYALLK